MRKQVAEAVADRGTLAEQLIQFQERLAAEQAASTTAAEKMESTQREVEIMRVELTAARQNMEKAEWEKGKVGGICKEEGERDEEITNWVESSR